jgi:hypothetical protein
MTSTINDYRTGVKAGARSEFLAIGNVIPGHEEELRQTLARHNSDPGIADVINQIWCSLRKAQVPRSGPTPGG